MANIDMDKLRSAFKPIKNSAGQNNYYPFYKMNIGDSAEIRFLPDRNDENPRGFLIEKKMHTLVINGEKKGMVCPKTWGKYEPCPICKLSSAYYEKDDKVTGKIYYRKLQYIGNVLVFKDPLPADRDTGQTHEGKTRYVGLGNQIYDVLNITFENRFLKVPPFLYKGGTNFFILKTEKVLPDGKKVGAYNMSRFAPGPSDLDDETIAHVESSLIDLSTLLPQRPDYDKLEAMLEASLKGESLPTELHSDVDHDTGDDETPTQLVSSAKQAAQVSTTETHSAKETAGNSSGDPEAEKILASLAARRRQQQAAKTAA